MGIRFSKGKMKTGKGKSEYYMWILLMVGMYIT